MKKNMISGIAVTIGMLSIGALSASASGSNPDRVNCADKQAYQQFTRETASLTSLLKVKEMELHTMSSYDGIDFGYDGNDSGKRGKLEEIRELKNRINAAAQKLGIPACSQS